MTQPTLKLIKLKLESNQTKTLLREADGQLISKAALMGAHGSLLAFVEKWNVEAVKKWKETRDSKGHWIAIHSPQWSHTEDLRRRCETSLEMLRWTVQWFKDRGHKIECQIMSDGESIGICEANESRSATP